MRNILAAIREILSSFKYVLQATTKMVWSGTKMVSKTIYECVALPCRAAGQMVGALSSLGGRQGVPGAGAHADAITQGLPTGGEAGAAVVPLALAIDARRAARQALDGGFNPKTVEPMLANWIAAQNPETLEVIASAALKDLRAHLSGQKKLGELLAYHEGDIRLALGERQAMHAVLARSGILDPKPTKTPTVKRNRTRVNDLLDTTSYGYAPAA